MIDEQIAMATETRSDVCIFEDIWAAICAEEMIRSLDIHDITVEVHAGEVFIRGHLARENNRPLLQEIARSMPGVKAVRTDLTTDYELTLEVAQTLFADERFRGEILPVGATHGWVRIGGKVASRALQRGVEETAARAANVRGVARLPRVIGEEPGPSSYGEPAQPRIGAQVYDDSGLAGEVLQVVICPANRLVTHAIVRSHENEAGRRVDRERVLPAVEIDQACEESVFLKPGGLPLRSHPLLNPNDYPPAAESWKAPYPYHTAQARWLFRP